MIDERYIFIGLALSFLGSVSYLLDTIRGKVKPNRVTWFLWALAPLIAFSAEIRQGVGTASLMTFMVGFNPLMIFLASFINKKSVWKISKFDIICGLISIAGLVMWYITKIGNIAILFAIIADGVAALPTLVKSFKAPETENYKVFLMSAISALITIFTIQTWNFAHYAFPLYILIVGIILTIIIKFKIGKKFKTSGN